jgi:SAM-dependent methyltransferase
VPDRILETTVEWRRLAKIDPLWAVATWPDKLGAWTPEEFYAVGRSDWEDFRHHWRQYEPGLGGTCLEIGCGAGRITHALAEDFDRVIALDVSTDMIELAAARVSGDVEFRCVDSTAIPESSDSVDAVFTCHVLQHLDGIDHVESYLREAYRVLRPGGTAMLHLGLLAEGMRWHGRVRAELALQWGRRVRREDPANLQMRVCLYRWDEICELLERIGFTAVELRNFRVRSNANWHAFWFARA